MKTAALFKGVIKPDGGGEKGDGDEGLHAAEDYG